MYTEYFIMLYTVTVNNCTAIFYLITVYGASLHIKRFVANYRTDRKFHAVDETTQTVVCSTAVTVRLHDVLPAINSRTSQTVTHSDCLAR